MRATLRLAPIERPCLRAHSAYSPLLVVFESVPTQLRTRRSFAASVKSEDTFMNIIIWLIVGGLIGWVASIVMRTNGQQGILLNVVVGVVGALLGGWFLSPLVGVSTINQNNFSAPSLLVSLLGAVILLAVVNLFRRGAVR
jgi:uncharacterized membrane protein YeaQ/YmgE (transglycosylase-associated protein family)